MLKAISFPELEEEQAPSAVALKMGKCIAKSLKKLGEMKKCQSADEGEQKPPVDLIRLVIKPMMA